MRGAAAADGSARNPPTSRAGKESARVPSRPSMRRGSAPSRCYTEGASHISLSPHFFFSDGTWLLSPCHVAFLLLTTVSMGAPSTRMYIERKRMLTVSAGRRVWIAYGRKRRRRRKNRFRLELSRVRYPVREVGSRRVTCLSKSTLPQSTR